MADTATLVAFALMVLGPVAAILAHELTHFVTIWPVAENVRIQRKHKWRLETIYDIYNDPWRMRYADISNLSPGIVGFIAFFAFLLLQPFAITLETLWVVPTWLVYTVGGSADYFFI